MFTPLDPGQIRILLIHPGDGDEEIVCDLERTTLAACKNTYDALSYVWGQHIFEHAITVSGESRFVTPNLYGALKHLRRKDGQIRTVWIDDLCIDQERPVEKSQQVRMMATIYHNAQSVVMWLGEDIEYDGVSIYGIAYSLLRQLQKVFDQHGLVDLDFQRTGPDGYACPGYGLPNTDGQEWIALARLFSNPYFERIWIIQEVVKATRAIVVCGSLHIEWEVMRDVARSVKKSGSLGNFEYDTAAPGVISVQVMADLKEGNGIDLLPLLVKTRSYQSSKEVDKAFALMNLSSNSQDVGIKIDYSMEKQPMKVWEKLALHSLGVHKSLACLSSAGLRSSTQQSWIPNWGDIDEGRACLALCGKDHYKASGDSTASIIVSEDNKILILEGYIVDSITVVAPNVPNFVPKAMKSGPLTNWFTPEENQARNEWVASAIMNPLEISKSAFKYPEGIQRYRELARTQCCDLLMTGEKADIDDAYKVQEWMIEIIKMYGLKVELMESDEIQSILRQIEESKPPGVTMEAFMHSAVTFGAGRSVCATKSGDLGRVPFGTVAGDLICIFKGGIVPFVLRQEGGYYRLVGECYVNGIMYGQALERLDLVQQDFRII